MKSTRLIYWRELGMISTKLFEPESVRNDKYKTYKTRKSQQLLVQDLSIRREPGTISTRLIKPKRARNDKYKTYQIGES